MIRENTLTKGVADLHRACAKNIEALKSGEVVLARGEDALGATSVTWHPGWPQWRWNEARRASSPHSLSSSCRPSMLSFHEHCSAQLISVINSLATGPSWSRSSRTPG